MKRVLILNASQRSSLAVTRSLGKMNVPLVTADDSVSALAERSRYSQKYLMYPSPQLQPEQFVLVIAEICENEAIDIVIPMTELTATLLLNSQHSLPAITLPFADVSTVDALADKCTLMRLAESLNIPVPRTVYADDPENLPVDLATLSYPLVLKPGKSWVLYENKWIHTTVQIANNASQANHILTSDDAFRAFPFMLQEFIPGKGEGVFTLYDKGKPLAFFAHRRLREKPPQGGVSVLSESVAVNPTLESYARQLLDHVGWHGVAMVEFRVTPDGKPSLMEINTRFWGSLQLAIDAGVDFPWLLYQTCNKDSSQTNDDHQIPVVSDYKIGQRLRWILGDFDSLYLVLRDKGFSLKEKVSAIVNFLTPHPFITRHEVNRWHDMAPFWWELKQYIKDLRK
ncbi:MAG: ATP-grasp domain-containing protein [Gammaproteobacteria bacterium]|nr:ATP-grasp domain-containing protein [Gammaproteobacteria bacterium]